MKLFSDRMGLTTKKSEIQINDIDISLKNGLWNVMYRYFFGHYASTIQELDYKSIRIYKFVWTEFFNKREDELPKYVNEILQEIKITIYKDKWYEFYNLLQYLVSLDIIEEDRLEDFLFDCNHVLERGLSGYRFIDRILSPITSDIEINTIEGVLSSEDIMSSVKLQISRSLELFSDRVKPDYRNSIKESISAVEGYCKIITGDPKATLAKALQKIEKTHPIHPSLKLAFDKLYAYTSDEGGIRHAMLDDGKEIAQEDALFMLIACSAFINYLQQKAAKS